MKRGGERQPVSIARASQCPPPAYDRTRISKKESNGLTRMVQVLIKEVRELRNGRTTGRDNDGGKENDEHNTRTQREK